MTLEDDIVSWLADRPDWQKDVAARFCRNESLSVEDVAAIADRLVAETYPVAVGITAADIPGSSATGEPVRIGAVLDILGVNALLPDQRLTFAKSGLTIVYGDNASGKSGYARLIRQAVTARVKAALLGDVFAQQRQDQQATFEFTVADAQHTWKLGDVSSLSLSSVRFYDEECGDAYVTSASEIHYRPSALTVLDRVSSACDALQQELNSRLSANQQQRSEMPLLAEGTVAATFLSSLSADTALPEIDEATKLADDHGTKLAKNLTEEARLKGTDPSKEKARLSSLAAHWTTVRDHVVRQEAALSDEALAGVQTDHAKAAELREAATIASATGFDAEPLPGVGSETWRFLWEAARAYSLSEAYHDHTFPLVGEDAVCVLCQQPLRGEASDRLARFQAFMKDTTERDASAAERTISITRESLVQLTTQPAPLTTALSQLQAAGQDVASVEKWFTEAYTVGKSTVNWIDGTVDIFPVGVVDGFTTAIQSMIKTFGDQSAAIDDSTFRATLDALSADVRELQARTALADARVALVTEVDRLKSRAKIEAAKRLTDTTGITRKATDLTTVHVTSIVRDQFTRETERLRLRRVTLDPTGGRKNVTLEHKPKLLGATVKARIDSVLSEGEQTALGLAGFLTEVEFDGSKSAIVLDDPVSSLDAGRRSRVAKRLVELAQSRQVIVFTHEATFVNALNKEARDQGVEVAERAIVREGDRPGKATDKHPWSVRDTRARIGELETGLARLQKDRPQLDSDQYQKRAQEWGGMLSQAWERAVNLEVVGEIVNRGTNEVKPRMFRMLAAITDKDDSDFQAGYARASEWAPRHDQAPETNYIPAESDELEAELKRFQRWTERIRSYKK
ncbi:AAA family ATPase [Cryobacterium sp. CG_9.6]|uniref:AAA family ATPase n=1 Tax=Cryobacterium sp. CG_9.6 TaxID=2760710 RepID=UPI00247542C3|nr:AAA family ATPase [Cryobacterium sp. CG_9.6]MDH6236284.1 energy-coupling factor transporter ATP-binding protein EcfA2 [Cryobacterium sp. CG_9.6]